MPPPRFFGWTVLQATFVLAVLGWGIGFYGPPVFLHAVTQRTGWPLAWVSAAVTLHFLAGTVVVANLPALYRRFGLPAVTATGSILLALGVIGWATAGAYWQLLTAAMLSGMGWVALGAAAVNAIIAPWFVVKRPLALGMAYNGASLGGVLFSPLWVWLIQTFGFAHAAWMIGLLSISVIGGLSRWVFSQTPATRMQFADGAAVDVAGPITAQHPPGTALPSLWHDRRFIALAAGMSLGLFAQIGLIAHLFSMLVPVLGEQTAGMAMAAATLCAILGRSLVGWLMPASMDRWRVAALAYAIQAFGSVVLLGAGSTVPLIWLGIVLFGAGIGNATSLPPLIAQQAFSPALARRVVPLIVAISQASYAFAPMVMGWVRAAGSANPFFYALVALIQLMAALCFLGARERKLRADGFDPSINRPTMTTTVDTKKPGATDPDKPKAGPATGQDAENQPADSTHDKEEAHSEVQRTATEGPRRMPQP